MGKTKTSITAIATVSACFFVTGCDKSHDSEPKATKPELLLTNLAEPSMTIGEAIASVSKPAESESDTDGAASTREVVVKAKVGSGKGDTFDTTTSVFLISEIPEGEHANDATHDASNCPFCRAREAKAPTVMVRVVDEAGQPYTQSADRLLGLKNGQHVIVKGTADFDSDLNIFTIETNGVQLLN